jgi:hypothetical protein
VETEFLIQSLSLSLTLLVKIQDIPGLTGTSVVRFNSNSLSFFILLIFNIKNFTVLPIDELVVLELENLEPSRVGRPDLHIFGSTCTLDIP